MNGKKYWEKRSKGYDKTNWVNDNLLMEAFLSMIPSYDGIKKVLDVGIGTGAVATEMLKKGKKVWGIDKSAEMVNKINNSKIKTIICDAHELPFENNHFDLICMRNVVHYLRSPLEAIKEIKRCLKSGGYFLFSQVIPFEDNISEEYDWLINRNIHYPTQTEITNWLQDYDILDKKQYILRSQSIMNWLNNTCENKDIKQDIINRHHATSTNYKSMVNFSHTHNDIFVDIKHLMILAVN